MLDELFQVDEEHMDYQLYHIHNHFQLPIHSQDAKEPIQENILTDLELLQVTKLEEKKTDSTQDISGNKLQLNTISSSVTKDTTQDTTQDTTKDTVSQTTSLPLYEYMFRPSSKYGKELLKQWGQYYTTDVRFLNDSIKLYKSYSNDPCETTPCEDLKCWELIKQETYFKEKYYFIDWKYFRFLNQYSGFLFFYAVYHVVSPLLSLMVPILLCVAPFFILKLQGHKISFSMYYSALKLVFRNHALGKLFQDFRTIPWDKRIYIVISLLFYGFQIYQNINTCIRFHHNVTNIHNYFREINDYINSSVTIMDDFLTRSQDLETYQEFRKTLKFHRDQLSEYGIVASRVRAYKWNFSSLSNIGYVLKMFYQFYYKTNIHNTFLYSFGFHGYCEHIRGIAYNLNSNAIASAKFKQGAKTTFKQAYYGPLVNTNPVSNNYNTKKNMVITGPNAAGKTTLLKTTLFNILLTQQVGCGFYKSATLQPYQKLYCYLNIPDTSGRDSLFQAEARRCMEIIESMENTESQRENERHFCIFDELYSGTNPYEAVASAFSFISYLQKKNTDFMLTTHFINLCEALAKYKVGTQNYKMGVDERPDGFVYSYKLESGISSIKGGVKVLRDLGYPEHIIESTKEYLKNN